MSEEESEPAGPHKKFDVELFIVHPSIHPDEITHALGLQPTNANAVGAQRKTRKGTLLEGNYFDTRWRHSERHETEEQWFVHEIDKYVDRLMAHKEFLHKIRSSGGNTCVIIQFIGDGYFGDQLKPDVIAKLAELKVDFGIEVYS